MPAQQIQGPALQGMFLHLMEEVDPATSARLHDDSSYRPYTLSPLGIGERGRQFTGFKLPRERSVKSGTPCYLRVTFLDDSLFPIFSRYFLSRPQPSLRLGTGEFGVTTVLASSENENEWSRYLSYDELIERASRPGVREERRIKLRFVTPTSFRKSDIDLPLPLPRLVFQSYARRFAEFCDYKLLADVVEEVDRHVGISSMQQLRTDTLKTKRVILTGFTGSVTFEISKKAPPELFAQLHLLAEFAFFCGTGKKTAVGMGQTITTGIEY
ncbi:MAG: CRISPR system precrRNA processing endoribonuclease RAMP protein Cas6 [bacterium]|nr:CRISPR system precrRNA processing endoribonuclease RAMP protein Cas6 [bacterium]